MPDQKVCSCGSPYVVNMKYSLCNKCNHKRLHGETLIETNIRKNQVYNTNSLKKQQQTIRKPAKIYYIPQTTNKKAKINKKLSKVKSEIELEALQDGTYYCKGCGSGIDCDKSHILSIKQHPELELDKENIDLLCRDCHMMWESGDIEKMVRLLCFERYLEYIKKHDNFKYNQILEKLQKWQSREQLETLKRN